MQNILSSRLLFKNIKIKIYNYNFACFFFLYGCATWSLMLREECGLSKFENRVLRRIFGPKSDSKNLHDEVSPSTVQVIKLR